MAAAAAAETAKVGKKAALMKGQTRPDAEQTNRGRDGGRVEYCGRRG